MASRFWTENESDGYSDSDTDGTPPESETTADGSKYYHFGTSNDDVKGNDQKRVVKSIMDKHSEEMASIVDEMKNAMKFDDWISLQETFDNINKLLEKVMKNMEVIPDIYIKALVMLEDFLNQRTTKTKNVAKKYMSNQNFKAMNIVKQKLKKNNKQYEELIIKFRENDFESEEEKADAIEEETDEEDEGFESTFEEEGGDDEDEIEIKLDEDETDDETDNEDRIEIKDDISEIEIKDEDDISVSSNDGKKKKKYKLIVMDNQFKDQIQTEWDITTKKFKEIVGPRAKKGSRKIAFLPIEGGYGILVRLFKGKFIYLEKKKG